MSWIRCYRNLARQKKLFDLIKNKSHSKLPTPTSSHASNNSSKLRSRLPFKRKNDVDSRSSKNEMSCRLNSLLGLLPLTNPRHQFAFMLVETSLARSIVHTELRFDFEVSICLLS